MRKSRGVRSTRKEEHRDVKWENEKEEVVVAVAVAVVVVVFIRENRGGSARRMGCLD